MNDSVSIRRGVRDDIPRVWELVCELAEFEHAREQVETSPEQLARDGFGPNPLFGVLVAQEGEQIVGMALYGFRYSTWQGKQLYLEDLIVTEAARGHGIGKALLEATMGAAREENCVGLMWQVLDWNTSAIAFYEKCGARFDAQWTNVRLEL